MQNFETEFAEDEAPEYPWEAHDEEGDPRADENDRDYELDRKHCIVKLLNQGVVDGVEAKSLTAHPLPILDHHSLD